MRCSLITAALFAALTGTRIVSAVDLYTENFEVNPTANWKVNPGPIAPDELGFGPDATHDANFFFDYSSVGIPLAPNSAPGATRGLKLQSNNDFNSDGIGVFTGFSVSPLGQDFQAAGDYTLTFDWWASSIGPFPGGGTGSTQLSTFGVGTNGTTAQWPGAVQNSVWFAATGDGNSSADWRVYSPTEAGKFSYQEQSMTVPDGTYVYEADPAAGLVRQNSHPYYAGFGSVSPPTAQTDLFPSLQTGTTVVGSAAFEWHEVEIEKIGNDISWTVDDVLIATVNLVGPDPITLGGGNIFFGHSDINATVASDPSRFDLLFTLIDNVKVATIEAGPVTNADFNGNGTVDAADYVVWRNNLGVMGTGTQATGDANADMNVNQADYDAWRATFGTDVPGGGLASSVPEPSSGIVILVGALTMLATIRRVQRVVVGNRR
jgi:hypothetical protein